jgi:hypothetical protein
MATIRLLLVPALALLLGCTSPAPRRPSANVAGPDAAGDCPIPGELVQWQADACLLESETDDLIAAEPCLRRESQVSFDSQCAGRRHYKQALCTHAVAHGLHPGPLPRCVDDPRFMGAIVRNGGG